MSDEVQGWNVLEHSSKTCTVKADPASEQAQMGVGGCHSFISVKTELTGPGDRSESQDWKRDHQLGRSRILSHVVHTG